MRVSIDRLRESSTPPAILRREWTWPWPPNSDPCYPVMDKPCSVACPAQALIDHEAADRIHVRCN